MRWIFASVSLIGLLAAGPAAAQRYWGPEHIPYCTPEISGEDCRDQSLALLLEKLELPEAETLAQDGYSGVRVFRYDAFGVVWPAVAFLTRPINEHRREGVAQARIIHADGHLARLERPAWESGWLEVDGVIAALKDTPPREDRPTWDPADRTSPPPPSCMDPPTVVIELIDDGQVQRWWPYMCRSDPAVAQTGRISALIAAAFPVCGHFDVTQYGSGLGRVRACLMVDGENPYDAVEVVELLRPGVTGDARRVYEDDLQSGQVALLGIDGRRAQGREAVLGALKNGALGQRWLRVLRATGDRTGVTVIGVLHQIDRRLSPDPVSVSIRWVKEADDHWRIVDWSVEQR